MKVRCINNESVTGMINLTVGKIYSVLKISEKYYSIKNDKEYIVDYSRDRFEEVEEVEKEKVLEVEFQEVFGKVAWRISYQNEDVLKRGEFEDDEIGVGSCYYPSYARNTLMLLGADKQKDNDVCMATKEEAEIIKQKVDAINDKYGIPKRWRAKEGEQYWFISGWYLDVFETTDCYEIFDKRQYEFGNYFKTKEEAQAKLEKIKQILQGE